MTRDELLAKWDSMTPRERDALVAEKVMRWERRRQSLSQTEYWSTGIASLGHYVSDWKPSTDISAAWEVVEELNGKFSFNIKRLGDYFYQDADYGWQALFTSRETLMVTTQTAPEAICIAALLAVLEDKPS